MGSPPRVLTLSGAFAALAAGARNDVAGLGAHRLGVLTQRRVVRLEHAQILAQHRAAVVMVGQFGGGRRRSPDRPLERPVYASALTGGFGGHPQAV